MLCVICLNYNGPFVSASNSQEVLSELGAQVPQNARAPSLSWRGRPPGAFYADLGSRSRQLTYEPRYLPRRRRRLLVLLAECDVRTLWARGRRMEQLPFRWLLASAPAPRRAWPRIDFTKGRDAFRKHSKSRLKCFPHRPLSAPASPNAR